MNFLLSSVDVDMLGGNVEIANMGDYVYIKGLYAKTFIRDIIRIYKADPRDGVEFFTVITSGFLIQRSTIRFHKYFALEVYTMFQKLSAITDRWAYQDAIEQLPDAVPDLKKYLTPPLKLPADLEGKLDELPIKLFPYQRNFVNIFYNSKVKLGLRGNILGLGAGTGKSLTALATVHTFNDLPCIIVAPKSTLKSTWFDSSYNLLKYLKPGEVQIIHDFNPKKKWKVLITNPERLGNLYQCMKSAAGPVKAILLDESQAYRYQNTKRSQMLGEVIKTLNIESIIPISATPQKGNSAELIVILKLLDPNFTDEVASIFRKMYNRDKYNNIAASVLQRRLSVYIDNEKVERKNDNFPEQVEFNVYCKIKDFSPYLLETMKKDLKARLDVEIPIMAKKQKPEYENLKSLVAQFSDEQIAKEEKEEYLKAVYTKMTSPMSTQGKEAATIYRAFEEQFKKLNPDLAKQIIESRKIVTSWLQITIGQVLAEVYSKRKIKCIAEMTYQNIDTLMKIIDESELKSIVFSTYVAPLQIAQEELQKKNVNGLLITGGMDTHELLQQSYSDNTIEYIAATLGSLSVGTDGMQKYYSTEIFLNLPNRSSEIEQAKARIYRRNAAAKSVHFYYVKLDTGGQKNILDSEQEIMEWSKEMFNIAMGGEDSDLLKKNPQGSIQESIEILKECVDRLD